MNLSSLPPYEPRLNIGLTLWGEVASRCTAEMLAAPLANVP